MPSSFRFPPPVTLVAIGLAAGGTAKVDWGSPQLWWTVAYLGVAATAGANLGFMLAVRRLSAMRTSAVVFLIPVVAIAIEIARGNSPSVLSLSGMCVAILGVALVNASLPRLNVLLGGRQVPDALRT